MVDDVEVPEPMREAPEIGTKEGATCILTGARCAFIACKYKQKQKHPSISRLAIHCYPTCGGLR